MKRSLTLVLLVLGAATIWWSLRERDSGALNVEWRVTDKPPLYFGLLPSRPDEVLEEEYGGVLRHLERELGLPVSMVISNDYQGLAELVRYEKVGVAWFSAGLYDSAHLAEHTRIICRPMRYGRIYTCGAIVVRNDDPIRRIEDLAGRRAIYVDRNSSSGFIFPARLLRRHGLDPITSFAEVTFSGNHTRSVAAILEKRADFTGISLDTCDESRVPPGLRVLALTDPIPADPIVAPKSMSSEQFERLRELFCNMDKYPLGAETLRYLNKIRGFERFLPEEEIQALLAAIPAQASPAAGGGGSPGPAPR